MSNLDPSPVSNARTAISFEEHLLKRRLRRLPIDLLIKFWGDKIDFDQKKSQKSIVDRILLEYQIKKQNPLFLNEFKDFLRDVVLTAREADYLISVKDPKQIINWARSW